MVFIGGLAPDYVLDKMDFYETEMFIENLHLKHRSSWEQARQLFYAICQVNSRAKLDPSDLMPFPWDTTTTEEGGEEEDPESVIQRMKEIENYLNNE